MKSLLVHFGSSIGKNLHHLFLLYHQSCTESLREIRGAQFKCKNNILAPSIGKNLQHLFLLYHQSCMYRIPTGNSTLAITEGAAVLAGGLVPFMV